MPSPPIIFLEAPAGSPPAVKICGVRSAQGFRDCNAAGADAIGINFYPPSKRYCPPEQAREWLPGLANACAARVGVFVNADRIEILKLIAAGCLDAAQLHGDESPEFCAALESDGVPVIKAVRVAHPGDLGKIAGFAGRYVLLDALLPGGGYGGEGVSFDWKIAADAVAAFPDKRILLAGGLTPANAAEAARLVRPAALDTASGVESAPGEKDTAKVRAFIAAAKSVAP